MLKTVHNPIKISFKIKDSRKTNFPAELSETDLYKIKVGSLFKEGSSLFTVSAIRRISVSDTYFNTFAWEDGKLRIPENSLDNYLHYYKPEFISDGPELFEQYFKAGKYGLCQIDMVSVFRRGVVVKKSKTYSFNEFDFSKRYTSYKPVDIDSKIDETQKRFIINEISLKNVHKELENSKALLDSLKQIKKQNPGTIKYGKDDKLVLDLKKLRGLN